MPPTRPAPPPPEPTATEIVDDLLRRAREAGASDVHIQPTPDGLDVRFRIDGVLQPAWAIPASVAPNVVARLKVLAGLLTYRTDAPQEGRIRDRPGEIEMRVSTFPTLHGERAAIRLFSGTGIYRTLDELGFPDDVGRSLHRLIGETSGAIVLSGPAGSGKTTTLYACLRELVARSGGGRSLASLEDPIEVAVPGVSQSQVNQGGDFNLATGLRSLLRQDPEVIAVGEIRDRPTAEGAFQASLTGHLVLTTFHAGSAAEAVGRLADMGIEPYLLRSGLLGVFCQRLLRRLCECAEWSDSPEGALGLKVERYRTPRGCERCGGSGYRGRFPIAEHLDTATPAVGRAILDRVNVRRLEAEAEGAGMVSRWMLATRAVEAGLTSPAEVRRSLGFGDAP